MPDYQRFKFRSLTLCVDKTITMPAITKAPLLCIRENHKHHVLGKVETAYKVSSSLISCKWENVLYSCFAFIPHHSTLYDLYTYTILHNIGVLHVLIKACNNPMAVVTCFRWTDFAFNSQKLCKVVQPTHEQTNNMRSTLQRRTWQLRKHQFRFYKA